MWCVLIGINLAVGSYDVIMMATKDLERHEGDAEMVLAMVTSPPLSSSDAGAILLGLW